MSALDIRITEGDDGHWHLLVGDADIRTPYQVSIDRGEAVGYALRAFPEARIVLDENNQSA